MLNIINPVTASIVSVAKYSDTIREISMKTGFAYSAVYRRVLELAECGMFELRDEGNRKAVFAKDARGLHSQFAGLINSVHEAERDAAFWKFIIKTRLKARLAGGAAISLWSRGSYITGDFFDRIYTLEAAPRDLDSVKKELDRRKISYAEINYTEGGKSGARPLILLASKRAFSSERIEGIPVMPLKELVAWCKRLNLDAVLEQLNALYELGLKTKYSEVHTNV